MAGSNTSGYGQRETYALPKDEASLVNILDAHIDRQKWDLNPRHTLYSLYNVYGNGARQFRSLNLDRGQIDWSFSDEKGRTTYRHTKIPALIDRAVARACSLNWLPKIKKEGVSLQSVRERASAQTILRHLVHADTLEGPLREFAWMAAAYGFAGFCASAIPHPELGITAEFTPIHPLELFSFPCVAMDPTRQRGILWRRRVPISYLEQRFGRAKIASRLSRLDSWTTQFGGYLEGAEHSGWGGYSPSGEGAMVAGDRTGGMSRDGRSLNEETVCEVRELWLDGPAGSCSRYILQCGDCILLDKAFQPGEYYCPISTARFMQSGAFKGLGIYDLLWSANRQTETMWEQLFENVRKQELYPVLMLPAGTFDGNVAFKTSPFGMKYGYYTPDPFGGQSKPIPIEPVNNGAFPAQVAQSGMAIMEDIFPEAKVLGGEAPGRVDSEGGLRFLDDQTFNPIASFLTSMRQCLTHNYRSLLCQASDLLTTGEATLPVNTLDSSMAGLILRPDGALDPLRNPLPKPALLTITVQDESPRTTTSRKQEAEMNVQMGFQSPQDALIFMLKEGLDPAVYAPEVEGAIRRTDRNIAVLYGDGETPGQAVLTPQTEVPAIALKILKGFMADPSFSAASVEVQNAFWDYQQYLINQQQPVLPSGMPNPDELALQQMGQQALIGGMGPPTKSPPSSSSPSPTSNRGPSRPAGKKKA